MLNKEISRRGFCAGMFAAAVAAKVARAADAADGAELDLRQREIDAITPDEFAAYWRPGIELAKDELDAATRRFPVLGRLEAAFEKVLREVKETVVTDIDHPAVWYVYNMGLIVKSPKKTFSIDLHHRRAEDMAPLLDFALITHNHNDHYTERFTHLMDRVQRKTVVNNFFSNYGVTDRMKFGGYTRAKSKTFHIGDVTVITGLCDHNPYLIDFTTPFEVQIGNFTLYHSGDCYSHAKLHVSRQPDLWVLHPRCGMDPAKACAETIRPKKAVVAHLQELGHAKGGARWTYKNGMSDCRRIEAAGFPAVMPLWGERLC